MSVQIKVPKTQRKQWAHFSTARGDVRAASPVPEPCPPPAGKARRLAQAQPFGERRRRRRRPEQDLQRAVLEHLELCAVPNCYWFHVGNGGWRSPVEAKVLKSLGVRPGVPDLILIYGGKTFGLELKTEIGKLTSVQRTAHVLMRAAGAEVEVAYGIDEALELLRRWQILRRRTT
jgi:hypothetical protein